MWEYISDVTNKDIINIALRGYITNNRPNPCFETKNKTKRGKPELNVEEEADTRTVSHVNDVVSNGFKKIIFASNDTDVVVYILNCACDFQNIGFKEFWIQYSSSDKTRFIPVHKLSVALGEMKCRAILNSHGLSGCDATSNVGTKAAVLKNLLDNFCKNLEKTMTVTFKIHIKKQKNILLKYGAAAHIVQHLTN